MTIILKRITKEIIKCHVPDCMKFNEFVLQQIFLSNCLKNASMVLAKSPLTQFKYSSPSYARPMSWDEQKDLEKFKMGYH